jgi:lipopolysaccharide export system protein LptA
MMDCSPWLRQMMRNEGSLQWYPKAVLAIFLFSLLSTSVFALESDKQAPLQIKADHVFFDHKKGINTYTGHVVLTQGTSALQADTIVVNFDSQDQLEKIVAKGKPAQYRTLFATDKPEVVGSAKIMEYYPAKNLLKLCENARIAEGQNSFEASQIEYNILKKVVTSAVGANGNIHITLQPHSQDP